MLQISFFLDIVCDKLIACNKRATIQEAKPTNHGVQRNVLQNDNYNKPLQQYVQLGCLRRQVVYLPKHITLGRNHITKNYNFVHSFEHKSQCKHKHYVRPCFANVVVNTQCSMLTFSNSYFSQHNMISIPILYIIPLLQRDQMTYKSRGWMALGGTSE